MEGVGIMAATFWKNKKVLVTGHEGFLGMHLTKKLLSFGARVTGLDINTKRKKTLFTRQEYQRIKTIKGDVANYRLVDKIISQNQIDVIFHLAAEALVGSCLKKPLVAFESNIKGTWNILEASRRHKYVKAIVIASSDKAYGRHKKLPYKEEAPLIADHPYDVSKSCADLLAHTYHHTYQVPVSVTRCGNIYGPGDLNFSRIVPDAIRCAIQGKTLNIRSDGKFVRDYVYVSDIVDGYIVLAEKLRRLRLAGEAFNFSDEKPLSVMQIVKKIYQQAGRQPRYKILDRASYEIPKQYLNSQKARRILGWKPKGSLERGLQQTIGWYKQYFKQSI